MPKRAICRAAVVSLAAALMLSSSRTVDAQTSTTAFERGWESGTPAEVTGPVTVVYADDFEHNRAEVIYAIRDERTNQPYRIRFAGEAPGDLRSGARITLSGHASGSDLYVPGAEASISGVTSSRTAAPSTSSAITVSGDHRTLVMVANFIDATVACSVADVDDIMFSNPRGYSVAGLYRDNSRGQLSFSGNVVGQFTINARTTDACDPSGWGALTDAAAAASGVDPASYANKVYVLPPNSCPASGYGTMSDSPGRAWVLSCGVQGIYAHELGHNLGMDHAGDATGEFGDWSDPMAVSTQQLRGLNAPHRSQLGWLTGSSVRDVTQSGFYDIAPLAIDPATAGAPQIVRIRKPDTGEYYYLSYRVGLGYDNYISDGYKNLLSVHRYYPNSANRTYLVDALADGKGFVDQTNGITVTMISHVPTFATARIDFASVCPSLTPSVTLTPSNQTGAAGGGATYAISLANKDGASCPSSVFALSATAPGGWGATVSPSTLTVAPGATGNATLTVQTAGTALAGTYNLYVDLTDRANAIHGTSGSGSYTVQADTSTPTAPSRLTATANQKLKEIDLSWNASSDNVGVAGYKIVKDGGTAANTKSTRWADTAWSPGATFTYSVVAYDQAGNASGQSNSVTVKLSGGDGGGGGGGKKP